MENKSPGLTVEQVNRLLRMDPEEAFAHIGDTAPRFAHTDNAHLNDARDQYDSACHAAEPTTLATSAQLAQTAALIAIATELNRLNRWLALDPAKHQRRAMRILGIDDEGNPDES